MKEKLDIAESIVTILMFLMAVWGSILSFEHDFWSKLYHVVDHYHQTISAEERKAIISHQQPAPRQRQRL